MGVTSEEIESTISNRTCWFDFTIWASIK